MDFRKVFDDIPEEFDKWRLRYCEELFADLIEYAQLDAGKSALEIGPGTGQATEPVLKTGCSYLAIELGRNLAEYMNNRFASYSNFEIVNDDFEIHDFGRRQFDLVYSAATIQWIPEEIGYPKVFQLLKPGGTFAMMLTQSDEKSADKRLYSSIQQVYNQYFHPQEHYNCALKYEDMEGHGFTDGERREYRKTRELTADDYISWISTHAPHLTLPEPYKSKFYSGIRESILSAGNRIVIYDTIELYLGRKAQPQ